VPGVRFARVETDRYRATLRPTEPGFESVLDVTYAVNYPREYGAYGQSPAVRSAVAATGGRVFEPGQAAAIAETVRSQSRAVREVRQEWTWAFLVLGLLVFLGEVAARRLQIFSRGQRTVEA
jgi:hypothetical protein